MCREKVGAVRKHRFSGMNWLTRSNVTPWEWRALEASTHDLSALVNVRSFSKTARRSDVHPAFMRIYFPLCWSRYRKPSDGVHLEQIQQNQARSTQVLTRQSC